MGYINLSSTNFTWSTLEYVVPDDIGVKNKTPKEEMGQPNNF